MPSRKTVIAVAIVGICAFLAGFVPLYQKASALEERLHARDQRVVELEREAKLGRALKLASLLQLEVAQKNFGLAVKDASTLFDQIRTLLNDPETAPALKAKLEAIATQRDAVIANLAKPDPEAEMQAQDILARVHQLNEP